MGRQGPLYAALITITTQLQPYKEDPRVLEEMKKMTNSMVAERKHTQNQ